jgi:2-keto-4-pentenoate hydratase/2-oxohepta-3-ene-1,7-dioic acid hydratase in catechol pathway
MKIFCVGRNYIEHAKELHNDVPDEPVIFLKPKSALIQPHVQFYYPEFTNELHYEAELVLRVSKNGKYIPDYAANRYYNAITVGIDFTGRAAGTKEKRPPLGKSKGMG